jgi:hypothetical protein
MTARVLGALVLCVTLAALIGYQVGRLVEYRGCTTRLELMGAPPVMAADLCDAMGAVTP